MLNASGRLFSPASLSSSSISILPLDFHFGPTLFFISVNTSSSREVESTSPSSQPTCSFVPVSFLALALSESSPIIFPISSSILFGPRSIPSGTSIFSSLKSSLNQAGVSEDSVLVFSFFSLPLIFSVGLSTSILSIPSFSSPTSSLFRHPNLGVFSTSGIFFGVKSFGFGWSITSLLSHPNAFASPGWVLAAAISFLFALSSGPACLILLAIKSFSVGGSTAEFLSHENSILCSFAFGLVFKPIVEESKSSGCSTVSSDCFHSVISIVFSLLASFISLNCCKAPLFSARSFIEFFELVCGSESSPSVPDSSSLTS